MQKLVIDGGRPLSGEIKVQGAKNAVLPVLAACTLCSREVRLSNCPCISDRYGAARILTSLGGKVRADGTDMTVDCTDIDSSSISSELMRTMRSSIIFMGALMGRTGKCTLCYPGGCDLGPRPIDMHLSAMKKMGAVITDEHGIIECSAPEGLTGCKISLSFPSVGATENILLAAVTAKGETVISNCAREPEITCLADFLIACGAHINGAGGSRITVEGVERLSAPHESFAIIPDRIAAATYLSCCACAGGELMLTDCCPAHMEAILSLFEQMGMYVRSFGSNIYIQKTGGLKAADTIRTMVYPGFPTDAQAIIMAPLCTVEGTTVFVENIFENRYRHTGALSRMGADIRAEGKVAVVTGVPALYGAASEAPDLRGGAAIVCAALGASGRSEITRTELIDRGYDSIEAILSSAGAKISRII